MSTIVTRAGKGSPLTNTELDSNFSNLNTDKAELSGATFTGNLSLGDNVKLQLGNQTDGDLQIYHDGSHSRLVDNGTGNFIIQAGQFRVNTANDAEAMIKADVDGAVSLYNSGDLKLATNSSGISVTGSVVADGLNTAFLNGDTNILLTVDADDNQTGKRFLVRDGSGKSFLKAEQGGDISFYEDTGTTPKFFWDASAEALGIGDANPSYRLDVNNTSSRVRFKAATGNSNLELSAIEGRDYLLQSLSDGRFRIYDEDASAERLTINADGSSVFSGDVTAETNLNLESGILTLKHGTGDSSGLRIFQDASDVSKIYNNFNGKLELGVGNTTAISIDSSENVNIPNGGLMVGATTAPTAPISIKSNSVSHSSSALVVQSASNTNNIISMGERSSDGARFHMYDGGVEKIAFYTDGTANHISAGNLGIGNSGPQAGVHITQDNTQLILAGAANTNDKFIAFDVDLDADIDTHFITVDQADALAFGEKLNDNDRVIENEWMRITNAGRVGIGTSSPSYALHVATNAGFTAEFQNTAGANHRPVRWTDNTGASVGTLGADFTANEFILQAVNKPLVFGTGGDGAERMRIDSSGRVGIGTVPETWNTSFFPIQIGNSGYIYGRSSQTAMEIGNNAYFGGSGWAYTTTNTAQRYIQDSTDNAHKWFNAASGTAGGSLSWSERMRIDSSGNLLVGKNVQGLTNAGFEVAQTGQASATQSGASCLRLNRLSSDGEILQFRKDGSTVGNIGTAAGNLYIVSNDVGLNFAGGGDGIYPATANGAQRDAAIDLGHSTHRFKDLFLSNNATAQKLTLTKDPVGTYTIEVDGTNTGQPNLIVKQSTSERFRCDNNGNLLVGKTSTDFGTAGSRLSAAGEVQGTVSGSAVAAFNRLSNDGEIATFWKDTGQVGSIGAKGGTAYLIGSNKGLRVSGSGLIPITTGGANSDATYDIGDPSVRFKDLYLSGGVYLGGTGAANKLSDFETGSWTPVFADAYTGGNVATVASGLGSYTKVGNLVTVGCNILDIDITGLTSSNAIYIRGLPFVTGTTQIRSGSAFLDRFTFSGYVTAYASGSVVLLFSTSNGSQDAALPVSSVASAGSDVAFTLQYQV